MAAADRATLAAGARAVLESNCRGDWTCPSRDLYPHQWLWDSCFVAVGLARVDPQRAAAELRSLLRGQWANGMLPHMIFADGSRDPGSRRIWRSRANPLAPGGVETSCITQPPIVAIAAAAVARALPAAHRPGFLAEMVPAITRYHQWLYRERDLGGRGLVTLIHPWECGLDTTPPWMEALRSLRHPWWLRAALAAGLAPAVRLLRRDTRYAPAAERPSDDDGLRMLVLAHRAMRYGFELRRMPPEASVLIEDVAFNSFLVVANRALAELAAETGAPLDPEVEEHARRTAEAIGGLWDEETGQYASRNAVTGELITIPTVATFAPLWAGSGPRARVRRLVALLRDETKFWPRFPVPSVPLDSPFYEEHRYWKGPTWVNTNWVLVEGLEAAGETGFATDVRDRTLDLVARSGFAEYFSARSGTPHGAPDFSWTAALTLDLLHR